MWSVTYKLKNTIVYNRVSAIFFKLPVTYKLKNTIVYNSGMSRTDGAFSYLQT